MESVKLQVYPQLLNDWVLEVSADFISEGEARNVHIRYQLDEQITVVSFDREKCEIILTNLLINALKHSPEGGEILIQTQLLPDEQSVLRFRSRSGLWIETGKYT